MVNRRRVSCVTQTHNFNGAEYAMSEQSQYAAPSGSPENNYVPAPVRAEPPAFQVDHAPPPAAYQVEAPVASGLAMKRRNPWLVWLVFPLITLGIYSFVWYYKIHREMADFDRRREVPVVGPLLVMIFLSWTIIAPMVSFYNTGKRIADTQRSAGLQPTCSPVIGLLLQVFLFGTGTVYYQSELNRVVDVYQAEPGGQVPLAA